jgi:hypothetical protein
MPLRVAASGLSAPVSNAIGVAAECAWSNSNRGAFTGGGILSVAGAFVLENAGFAVGAGEAAFARASVSSPERVLTAGGTPR